MNSVKFRAALLATIFVGCLGGMAVEAVVPVHPDYTATKASATYGKVRPNRLVGVGCGPDRVTMAAVEEDEFPGTCDAIGKPEEFGCRADDTPDFCVAYLGRDGW